MSLKMEKWGNSYRNSLAKPIKADKIIHPFETAIDKKRRQTYPCSYVASTSKLQQKDEWQLGGTELCFRLF